MRVDRVLLQEGHREVEVIEECHCEVKLSQCTRVPALRTYYAETPYETVIDVGGCSQSKGSPGVCVECILPKQHSYHIGLWGGEVGPMLVVYMVYVGFILLGNFSVD